jgi:hypothetical protein
MPPTACRKLSEMRGMAVEMAAELMEEISRMERVPRCEHLSFSDLVQGALMVLVRGGRGEGRRVGSWFCVGGAEGSA